MWAHSVELEWIRELHTYRTPLLDAVFKFWNYFDTVYFFLLLIPLVWIFGSRRVAVKMGIIFFLSFLVNKALKFTFDMPRPHHLDPSLGILTPTSPGFPSGAAQSAVLMCGIIVKEWKSRWRWVVGALYALLLCFSRVYLGVHFPTDIIGGVFIGILLFIVYLNLDRLKFGSLLMAGVAICTPVQGASAIYAEQNMEVVVPERQLAPGSVRIQNAKRYNEWDADDHRCCYSLTQKIARCWENRPFLVYGHEASSQQEPFHWEVVPYHQTGNVFSRFWQQWGVAWRVIFGGISVFPDARKKQEEKYKEGLNQTAVKLAKTVGENDAFCNPEVIKKQQVLEGKRVHVLYNYAPLGFGKDKLHFLIVPKEHRRDFRELTCEEYKEASILSQFVIGRLKESQEIEHTYLFHKTGKDAGQTVPHWHLHVVATKSGLNDLLSKINWLWMMVIGSKQLKSQELQSKVQHFTELFKKPV